MRNISFSATVEAFKDQTKTVTRRLGWDDVYYGEELCGVEKGMGLKKGEKINRLGVITVICLNMEPLNNIIKRPYRDDQCQTIRRPKRSEVEREGFPEMTAEDFVEMFLKMHKGKKIDGEPISETTQVKRVAFKYNKPLTIL